VCKRNKGTTARVVAVRRSAGVLFLRPCEFGKYIARVLDCRPFPGQLNFCSQHNKYVLQEYASSTENKSLSTTPNQMKKHGLSVSSSIETTIMHMLSVEATIMHMVPVLYFVDCSATEHGRKRKRNCHVGRTERRSL
jgi:hypothetical protein